MKTRISAREKDFPEEKLLLYNAAAKKQQETLVLLSALYCAEAQEKATGWRKAENIKLFVPLACHNVLVIITTPTTTSTSQSYPWVSVGITILKEGVRGSKQEGWCLVWVFLMVKPVNMTQNFTENNFIYPNKDVKAEVTQKLSHCLISEFRINQTYMSALVNYFCLHLFLNCLFFSVILTYSWTLLVLNIKLYFIKI